MADPVYAGGHTSTIAFTTSGLVAPMRSIGATEFSRGAIAISHLAAERVEYAPGGLSEVGPFDVEFLFNIAAADYSTYWPDIDDAAETVTITFPNPMAYGTPAKITGTAFWVGTVTPEIVTDDVLVGKGSLQWEAGDDKPVLSAAAS